MLKNAMHDIEDEGSARERSGYWKRLGEIQRRGRGRGCIDVAPKGAGEKLVASRLVCGFGEAGGGSTLDPRLKITHSPCSIKTHFCWPKITSKCGAGQLLFLSLHLTLSSGKVGLSVRASMASS